jgi:phage-related protein
MRRAAGTGFPSRTFTFPAEVPESSASLEGKLWEMRMKGKDGIARAIYVTAERERVVVLHAFTKKHRKCRLARST